MMFKRKAKRIPEERRRPEVISQKGFGTEMPPQRELVAIYFDQKGFATLAGVFYQFFEQADWRSPKGTPYRNWKLLAVDWIFNYEQELKLRRRQRQNLLAN
jgi:hypothetical protein